MNRTQIYLSEPQQAALAALAKQRGTTASALIRSAIDDYLAEQQSPRERLASLRALGSRLTRVDTSSTGAGVVENLRAGDSARPGSGE